jgi:streptogramin lyase
MIEARGLADPSHALVAVVRVGEAPVGLTAAPNGTVLVSNFSSGQLETVDTATIP